MMLLLGICLMFLNTEGKAQATTSWKGTGSAQTGTDWNEPTNWTNGVPDATKHAVIGDANFIGGRMPVIDLKAQAVCLSLTVGGTTAAKLSLSNDKGLLVNGNILIDANGELENEGSLIQVSGNWTNNGVYTELLYIKGNINSRSTQYPKVEMMGSSSQMGGSSANSFNSLIVSGTLTLKAGVNLLEVTKGSNTIQPTLQVNGTLDPGIYLVNIPNIAGVKFQVAETATLYVKGATYWSNYTITPTLWYTASTINYGGANQTIESSIVYGVLRVSGSGVKKLNGNTRIFGAQDTRLFVDAATLDLETNTINRDNSPGGILTIASGATLRIGGTNTLPANYGTYTLHANSTVEYYGTNQTVANVTYGHLLLSTSGTKTMPTSTLTVAGNLTSSGTVSFTAGAPINVDGNVTIGSGTTFNGGSALHTIGGNWAANGTFVGNTSTVIMSGNSKTISSTAGATEFNNLTLNGTGTSITVPSLTMLGNLSASGGLSQVTDGTITMTNTSSKSITGASMNFQNLTINGTVTTASDLTLNGNFTANAGKSFTASAGTVRMAGASKSIAGAGSMSFWGLNIVGATSTTSSFTVNSSLSGANALVATAGTVTFGGTSTFADAHYLFNAAITGTSMKMLTGATMYVANTMTKGASSVFDVTSTPNYVYYNGTSPQAVLGTTYHHLILTNTGAKTAGGAFTVNGNFTLATGATFNAGTFNHSVQGSWSNSGTFNHNNGTITFSGGNDASISGATTFSTLGLNKSSMAKTITLNNDVTSTYLQMTNGTIQTGSYKVTLLNDRSGDGWVIGNLTRSHAFIGGAAYAFNGPYAQLTFSDPVGINEVSMAVAPQSISGFTTGTPVGRKYTVSIAAGTYTNSTLQLQYLDSELNGNDESALKLYRFDNGTAKWQSYGRTSLNGSQNWVSRNTITDVTGEWAMASSPSIYTWVGGTSTVWENAANWQDITEGIAVAATSAPLSNDEAILGEVVPVNSPAINSAVTINSLKFKGAGQISLTLVSGSLNVTNTLTAVGSASGMVHTLATNNNNLSVGGDLILNDGSTGNSLSLVNTAGNIAVVGSITHPAEASLALGSGTLTIGGNYNYTSGAGFTAGTSTVTYNGSGAQIVAPLAYHHLIIGKTAGTATLASGTSQSITGNLAVSGSGNLSLSLPELSIAGGVSVTGGTLTANTSSINLAGSWSTASSSSFVAGTATVTFSGGTAQTVSATTFNNLVLNKTSTLTTTGNLALTGNLDVERGTLVMDGHAVNRNTLGGTLQVAEGAGILTRGTVGFPGNFATNTLNANSTVLYDAGTTSIAPLTYGYLVVMGGGTKSLQNDTYVANDMLIDVGAELAGPTLANLTLAKNLQNDGTLNVVRTNLIFTAAGAQFSGNGNTMVDNVTVNAGGSLTISKSIRLQGSLTNNGTALDAAGVEVDFTGGGAASITSGSTAIGIGNLKVSKSGATVSLGADVVSVKSINVTGGTFDLGSRSISEDVAAASTSLAVASGATLKVGGTNTLPAIDTYAFDPASTMVYNGGAQSVMALDYGNLTLENGGTKMFASGNTGVAAAYTITGGATADMLTNSSTVNFNGTGAQAIPGLAYHGILVSGGSEKTLIGNATVASNLELENGTIVTGSNKFILGNTASIVETEDNYVTGLVQTQRNVVGLEAFGNIGLVIDSPVSPGTVTVLRETGAVVGLNSNSAKRNFSIMPSGTNEALNATITLSYFMHEIGSIAESNLSVYATKDDVYWTLQPEYNTTQSTSRKTVALSGVNTLTRVTLGDRLSPLPVDLGYFKAEKLGQDAILNWTTTNEEENKGFEIEVSTDGKAYRTIGFVSKGTGTSRVATLYTFTDKESGKQGTRYYRLKQLDFDGRMNYYGPRALIFEKESGLTAMAYPNPFQSEVQLSVPAETTGMAKISMYDTTGKVMLVQNRNMEIGTNTFSLDTANKSIPAGIYVVTVEIADQLQRIKLIKK